MLCRKLKNLVSLSQPIKVKPKPIVTCLHHFLAFGDGYTDVFVSSSDCFIGLFVSTVIGHSDYFNGFGFTLSTY